MTRKQLARLALCKLNGGCHWPGTMTDGSMWTPANQSIPYNGNAGEFHGGNGGNDCKHNKKGYPHAERVEKQHIIYRCSSCGLKACWYCTWMEYDRDV